MKRALATALLCLAAPLCLAARPAAAASLPPAIAKSGQMTVAIVPNYPPLEFRDPATNKLTGFDVELGEAIAKKLGVKIVWQETSFSQMLNSLHTGRVDAILSGMTDLAARHQVATFIDYLRTGPQFFVQAKRAGEFKSMADLCGKKVGASRRTSYPKEIAAWSTAHCNGHDIQFVGTDGSADARTQLLEGRVDAAMQGNETLPYLMQLQPNSFALVGGPIATQYDGLALPADQTEFQKAVAGALDAMIADGSYKALLAKWHLQANGIEKALINAGQ